MIQQRDMIRCGSTIRWHAVATRRHQNLSEHHFNAAKLGRVIALAIIGSRLTAEEMLLLYDYLLEHDMAEILSGDISSNTKAVLKSAGCGEVLQELEYTINPKMRELEARMKGTPLAIIAKLADLADAIVFIHNEGQGNMEARIARDMCTKLLDTLVATNVISPLEPSTRSTIEEALSQSVSHADSIQQDLTQRFQALCQTATELFPDYPWGKAGEILDDLLYGPDSKLEFEQQLRKA